MDLTTPKTYRFGELSKEIQKKLVDQARAILAEAWQVSEDEINVYYLRVPLWRNLHFNRKGDFLHR
jgi:hypothetical protein